MICSMRGCRNFRRGGGGGVQVYLTKKALIPFHFFFTEVIRLISKKTIIFQGSSGGLTFSRGSNFFQGVGGGVQLLIPYKQPI